MEVAASTQKGKKANNSQKKVSSVTGEKGTGGHDCLSC